MLAPEASAATDPLSRWSADGRTGLVRVRSRIRVHFLDCGLRSAVELVGSARRGGRQPEEPRRIDHPLVVGHDRFEIVADGHRGGEVDGVERAEHLRAGPSLAIAK